MNTQFEKEFVQFCIYCGSKFDGLAPEKDAKTNVITCGNPNDPTSGGCLKSFVVRSAKIELETPSVE